jgi:hypothetical protein
MWSTETPARIAAISVSSTELPPSDVSPDDGLPPEPLSEPSLELEAIPDASADDDLPPEPPPDGEAEAPLDGLLDVEPPSEAELLPDVGPLPDVDPPRDAPPPSLRSRPAPSWAEQAYNTSATVQALATNALRIRIPHPWQVSIHPRMTAVGPTKRAASALGVIGLAAWC